MGGKAALILVLGFVVLFSYIGSNIIGLGTRSVDNVSYYSETTTAHNIAEVGINVGLSILYKNSIDTTAAQTGWTPRTITSQSFNSGIFTGGSFVVRLQDVTGGFKELVSTSVLNKPSNVFRDTIKVLFSPMAGNFTVKGFMTNFGGNDEFWITKDTMFGPIHFNGNCHIRGSPVFWEKVTLSKGFDPRKVGSGTNQAILKKGYETGVKKIDFPTDANTAINFAKGTGSFRIPSSPPATAPFDTARQKVYYTSQKPLFLVFTQKSDSVGLLKVYQDAILTSKILANIEIRSRDSLVLVSDSSNVIVRGRVLNRVTVVSKENIRIDSNITYSPRVSYNHSTNKMQVTGGATDMLALIAYKDIILDNTETEIQTTLNIYGVLFAINGSIVISNNNLPTSNNGPFRSYGGLITDGRVNVAKITGPNISGGYYKRFYFDDRMATRLPPLFPRGKPSTSRYEIISWWENVRLPKF